MRSKPLNKFIKFLICLVFFSGCEQTVTKETYTSGGSFYGLMNPTTSGNQHLHLGEPFSISLAVYQQDDQQMMAVGLQQRAKQLLNDPKNEIWIEQVPGGLSVNYGHYKTKKSAQKQLGKLKNVYQTMQPGAYQFAVVKLIPMPDPPEHPEWNLASQNCGYSLLIASYYNVPEKKYLSRKKDAVDAVSHLRQQGEQAFYFHGYHESLIFIGCMPKNVAPMVKSLLHKKHNHYYENSQKVYTVYPSNKDGNVKLPNLSYFVDLEEFKAQNNISK